MQLGAALGRTTQYVIRKLLGTGRIPCDTPTKADGAETLGDTPSYLLVVSACYHQVYRDLAPLGQDRPMPN